MSFLDRATTFLAGRVAPRLVLGGEARNHPTLADLERVAREELEACIRMGRPGADEGQPRAQPPPSPRWPEDPLDVVVGPVIRPMLPSRTRPVSVHSVTLDALPGLPVVSPPQFERLTEHAP